MNPLAHDATDNEAYGRAMAACQGYAPACSDAGECLHDGMCFSNSGRGFKSARQAIQDLVDSERNVFKRSWLKLALNALDHHQFLERGSLDAMRFVTISKRIRREYGMKD